MPNVLFTDKARKQFSKLDEGTRRAVIKALNTLKENPSASCLRLHTLNRVPKIWKIDIFPNHSWQISMTKQVNGDWRVEAIAPHSWMDRSY